MTTERKCSALFLPLSLCCVLFPVLLSHSLCILPSLSSRREGQPSASGQAKLSYLQKWKSGIWEMQWCLKLLYFQVWVTKKNVWILLVHAAQRSVKSMCERRQCVQTSRCFHPHKNQQRLSAINSTSLAGGDTKLKYYSRVNEKSNHTEKSVLTHHSAIMSRPWLWLCTIQYFLTVLLKIQNVTCKLGLCFHCLK